MIFKKPFITIAVAILFITAFALWLLHRQRADRIDVRLATPAPFLQEVLRSGSPAFLSPEFFPFVPEDRKTLLPSIKECEAAARDKTTFWKLNRDHHFEVVLLGANPAWSPLLHSLLLSPLWVLSDVTPWGYLFKPNLPGSSAWQPPAETVLKEHWPMGLDRARFMILTASNLAAINHGDEAEALLEMAAATHELPSLILSTQASLAACRGNWQEAATRARESLHADRHNRGAQEILIRALVEKGLTDEALEKARSLVATQGEDEGTLFLLARAANAANSRAEEIDSLARLVTVAKKHGQPLGASLSYLGQAYAKNGQRSEALHAFQEAFLAPELTGEERKVIREIMDHLMEGNVPSSTLPPLTEGKREKAK